MAKQDRTQLGKFLREYRSGAKLTQTALEERLGIKTKGGYVSRLESGAIQRPEDNVLRKIAEVTKRSLEDLQAMCQPADPEQGSVPLRMACGYSLWNAPIRCAVGGGGLPDLRVSSFYRCKGEGTIESEDIRPDDLEWMARFSERPSHPEAGTRSVPLSAADVVALLDWRRVEIGALPGNLARDVRLKDKLICVGTIVDSEAGCHFVCPAESAPKFSGQFLDTPTLGNHLRDRVGKAQKGPTIRVGVEEETVAAEYLDQALYLDQSFGGDTLRHEIAWNCRASEMGERPFAELEAACKREHGTGLAGVLVWEPIATWLVSASMTKGQRTLKNIPMSFVPVRGPSEKRPRLTYEIVIARSHLADPAPKKASLYRALTQIMNASADAASILNNIEKTPSTTLRRLAEYYRFIKPDPSPQEATAGIKLAEDAIASVTYSVRWNVVPELAIGPLSENPGPSEI